MRDENRAAGARVAPETGTAAPLFPFLNWPRVAVAGGTFCFIFVALFFLPNSNGSERFHIAVPLAAAADLLVFGRRKIIEHWPYVIVGLVLGMVSIYSFLNLRASQIGGRLNIGEALWWALFVCGLFVLYRLVYQSITFLIRLAPWVRTYFESPGGMWLRLVRSVLALALFAPYLYATTNIHRSKTANTITPLQLNKLPYENVWFPAADDGIALSGWFVPAPHSMATVLVCHGISANKSGFLGVVPFLHKAGYNVFLFDFRGHGDSAGHTTSFGYYEARDVRGALAYLHSRPDCKSIGALAFSMGGSSLLHAIPNAPELRGVVVDSTFADLSTLADLQMDFLPSLLRRPLIAAISAATWLEIGIPLSAVSPRSHIAQVSPRPLLLIHGLADGLIPTSQARLNFAAASEPKQLWLVPDAGHCGADTTAEAEYEQRVTAFFRGCLK